jgi:hypothetical protein
MLPNRSGFPARRASVRLAEGDINQHHEQKKRIEARKPRPQKSRDPARALCGHQLPVIVVNHKTAQDEKKSHPESGDLADPENKATGRFMVGQNPCKPVPDKHGKGRNKTQPCQCRQILSKKFVARPAIRDLHFTRARSCFVHSPASPQNIFEGNSSHRLFIAAIEVSSKYQCFSLPLSFSRRGSHIHMMVTKRSD